MLIKKKLKIIQMQKQIIYPIPNINTESKNKLKQLQNRLECN